MMDKIKVSLGHGVKDNMPKEITLAEAYERIRSGASSDHVFVIRSLKKKGKEREKEWRDAKMQSNYVIFQGTFEVTTDKNGKKSGRKKTGIKDHSGLAVLDFDHINGGNPEMMKKMLFGKYPFINAAWISPSGDGVKATVRIPKVKTDREYKKYYLPLLETVAQFSPNSDKSNKDISRLCFESHDPDILLREWEETAMFKPEPKPKKEKPAPEPKPEKTTGSHRKLFESLRNGIASRGSQYHEDNRHPFLFQLIKDCIKFGIPKDETFSMIKEHYTGHDGDLEAAEIDEWGERTWNDNYSEEEFGSKKIEYGKSLAKALVSDKGKKKKAKEPNAVQTAINYLNYSIKKGDILFNVLTRELIIRDGDSLDKIYIELRSRGMNINQNDLRILLIENYSIHFNPVSQFFDKLMQDYTYEEVEGSIKRFCKYVDAEDNELFDSMFRKHLIRCVGQGRMQLTNRFVFVLQQIKQYTGKSEWIRYLNPFGTEMYSEKVDEKNPILTLSQAFMINLEELESFNKRDVNWIKSVISMSHDQVRDYYTQVYRTRKRIGSFWGSTNKIEWLDDGENTRWVVMQINSINFDYNNWHTGEHFDIKKVWAEATYLWEQNASYEPTREEWVKMEEINKKFAFMSDHDHWVEEYLIAVEEEDDEYLTSATRIADYLVKQGTNAKPQKTGAALQKAGFTKVQKRIGTEVVKGYYVMTRKGGKPVNKVLQELEQKEERRKYD
jgi:hypothetical protein